MPINKQTIIALMVDNIESYFKNEKIPKY